MNYSVSSLMKLFIETLGVHPLVFIRDRRSVFCAPRQRTGLLQTNPELLFFRNDLQLRMELSRRVNQHENVIIISDHNDTEEDAIQDIVLRSKVVEVYPTDIINLLHSDPAPQEFNLFFGDEFWEFLPSIVLVMKSLAPRTSSRTIISLTLATRLKVDLSPPLTPAKYMILYYIKQTNQTNLGALGDVVRRWFMEESDLDLNSVETAFTVGLHFFAHLYSMDCLIEHVHYSTNRQQALLADHRWKQELRDILLNKQEPLILELEFLQSMIEQDPQSLKAIEHFIESNESSLESLIAMIAIRPLQRSIIKTILSFLSVRLSHLTLNQCEELGKALIKLANQLANFKNDWILIRTTTQILHNFTQALALHYLQVPEITNIKTNHEYLQQFIPQAEFRYTRGIQALKSSACQEIQIDPALQSLITADTEQITRLFLEKVPELLNDTKRYEHLLPDVPGFLSGLTKSGYGRYSVLFLIIDGLAWQFWDALVTPVDTTLQTTHKRIATIPVISRLPSETEFSRRLLFKKTSEADWGETEQVLAKGIFPEPIAYVNVGTRVPERALLQRTFFIDDARIKVLITSFFDKLAHELSAIDPMIIHTALQPFIESHLITLLKDLKEIDILIIMTDHGFVVSQGIAPPVEGILWRSRWGIVDKEAVKALNDQWLLFPMRLFPWLARYGKSMDDIIVFPKDRVHIDTQAGSRRTLRLTHGGCSPEEMIVPWSIYGKHALDLERMNIAGLLFGYGSDVSRET